MKFLKKWGLFLLSLIVVQIFIPIKAIAASGTISVSGTSQVVVGNSITITVKLTSGTGIGSWQMQLNYDKSYLQLTSSSAEAGGTVMVASSTTGIKSKSYTFKFKALKTGSTKVSVSSYEAYAFSDMSEISLTSGSKSVKIITQQQLEDSYSKDNSLKNLTVEGYELNPAFNKDTLNYTVNVQEGTTSVNVKAEKNDSKATVQGDGVISVSEGANNVAIVVRAENGSEKTYNLVLNVIDQNPINIQVDNKDFTVIKLRNNYICPELFTEGEIEINGFKVPTCVNSKINYTLVGLKEDNGTVTNYIYNNNHYTKYLVATGTSLKVVVLNNDKEITGLTKTQEKIDDIEYNVYKYNDNSKNYIVYGMNIETGEKNYYIYDSINKTFALYDDNNIKDLKEENQLYLYVIMAFSIALVLSLICIISLSKSKKKLKNLLLNNKKIEEPKKKEKNDIKEEENASVIEDDDFLKDVNPKEKKKKDKQKKKEENK